MNETIAKLLKPLASLRLTVVLLALTMVLIFAGTWAQIDQDVWTVQQRYFHSFLTYVHFQLFLPREALADTSAWKPIVEPLRKLGFPMPGGYTLIGLLLLNLLAAHTVRFKLTRKRIGIILIHVGIVLLILGEVVASIWQVEGQMIIDEGQTVSYTQDVRQSELAIIDPSSPEYDDVTVIPAAKLVREGTISYPTLPFDIRIDKYMRNSTVVDPRRNPEVPPNSIATDGAGVGVAVFERPPFTGTGAEATRVNAPSAYITLMRDGRSMGTYLVSLFLNYPQPVVVDGKTYLIDLRWKREYKPYSITLLKFSHDKYTGSETPRNYSSRVRLVDPTRGEDREVLIWMNNPLRYAGETLYQSGFNGPTTTILQVVRNPGWLLPYISCTVVALGMIVHFGAMLIGFLNRTLPADAPLTPARARREAGEAPGQYVLRPRGGVVLPLLVTTLCVVYLLNAARPPKVELPVDFNTFARLPISYEGRVMPLDTLAKVSLRVISGKSTLRDDGERIPAIRWLADTFANPAQAASYPVFRIDHPDLKSVLALDDSRKIFSIKEIFATHPRMLDEQFQMARAVDKSRRTAYQRAVFTLAQHVQLFNRLAGLETLYLAPPLHEGEDWTMLADALSAAQVASDVNPGVRAFHSALLAYHQYSEEAAAQNTDAAQAHADTFNSTVRGYASWFHTNMPAVARRVAAETLFNWFQPFYHAMLLYGIVFFLICAAWLAEPWRATLLRAAFWVLILTLALHTLALAARIYIQGRPPVTNLYSSAIFIGWAATLFCVAIEWLYRNGIGSLSAAIIAFPTLVIAHFLAGSGDTMQMLQAVLDTNFWLATHVVIITIGYSATFLAGAIALVYIFGSVFTRQVDDAVARNLARMTYGVVCFALLFSFVGTVLGGIWADQSWGRFWGWDPKENGAALLVLWNAIILHARWGGLIRERGLALMAIFGTVITAFSWFGTNMLGIGLHAYGFMDSGVFWLSLFAASQFAIMALGGLVPRRFWRSSPQP